MTAQSDRGDDWLTVDELAAATGMTVRTTRYYAGLGLLPPPERRGRMAYYGPVHRARLELIRSLQDHGFTLAAIEKYLKRLSNDASIEELAVQRAMLTSWTPGEGELLTRRQLEVRAGRKLSAEDIEMLDAMSAIRARDAKFAVLAPFDVAIKTLELGLSREALLTAGEMISRHMDELADELTGVLREQVLVPMRSGERPVSAADLDQTVQRLRQLTLEAVVSGFQRAANEIIFRSLDGPPEG